MTTGTADIEAREGGAGAPADAGPARLNTRRGGAGRAAWLAWLARECAAQADDWFLWAPVAFGTGCGIYFALPAEPAVWAASAVLAACLVLGWAVRRWTAPKAAVILATLLAFGAAGFFAATARSHLVRAPIVAAHFHGDVKGWVVDVAGPGSGGKGRLLVAPYDMERVSGEDTPALVRVTLPGKVAVGPGDMIRFPALLNPPPTPASPGAYDFARDAWFQRVGGVGIALGDPEVIRNEPPPILIDLVMRINAARWALAERIVGDMGPRTGGMGVAMVTGHEAWLDPDDVTSMRSSGLAHILSISGVHMAIVGGFVFFLVRLLIALWPWLAVRVDGKKAAAAAALAALGVYLVVSGWPPPAIRSAITLSVAFLAILADRRAITLRSLAIAALVVLALQPEAIVQPGFQMSFAATASLIALAEAWPRPPKEISVPWPIRMAQKLGGWFLAAVAISLVAGLATSAFAIQHFNRVALYGLPANLVSEPLSAFVIMPGLALGAVADTVGLGRPFLAIAAWGLQAMMWVSNLFAGAPHAVMTVASAPAFTLPMAFLGLLFICLWKGRLRWLGLPFALAVSLWPRPAPPAAWVAADAGAAAVVNGKAAVFARPDTRKFASDLWARRRGLSEPDAAQAMAVRDAHFDCNRIRCLPKPGLHPQIAAWWTRRKPSDAMLQVLCDRGEIVVVKADVALPGNCGGKLVLKGADFDRGGAAEVYREGSGWRVVWAQPLRGDRPWAASSEE